MLIVLGFVRMMVRSRDWLDGGKSREASPTRLCHTEQLEVWWLPLSSTKAVVDWSCFI
jgi:hypothetical protein